MKRRISISTFSEFTENNFLTIIDLISTRTIVSIQNLKNDVLYKGIMRDFIDNKYTDAFVDKIVCRLSVSNGMLIIVVD